MSSNAVHADLDFRPLVNRIRAIEKGALASTTDPDIRASIYQQVVSQFLNADIDTGATMDSLIQLATNPVQDGEVEVIETENFNEKGRMRVSGGKITYEGIYIDPVDGAHHYGEFSVQGLEDISDFSLKDNEVIRDKVIEIIKEYIVNDSG